MKFVIYIAIIIISMVSICCQSTKNKINNCCYVEVYYEKFTTLSGSTFLLLNPTDSVYFISYPGSSGVFEFGKFRAINDSVIFYPSIEINDLSKKNTDTIYIKTYIRRMLRNNTELKERDEWRFDFGPDTLVDRAYRDFKRSKCYPRIF